MAGPILLDTCVTIWWSGGDLKLSKSMRDFIVAADSVSVSAFSIIEIAMLSARHRLNLDDHWKSWFRTMITKNDWSVLPATWEIMEEAYSLPGDFHGDPADRILVATSRVHRMSIITPDDRIRKYPHVESVW